MKSSEAVKTRCVGDAEQLESVERTQVWSSRQRSEEEFGGGRGWGG